MIKTQSKDNERRSFKRIKIPGAQVRYKKSRGLTVLKNYSSVDNILNVSKSGISFHMPEDAKFGESVQMRITFPDGNDLNLKGRVRWQKPLNGSEQTIGVLFDPFGSKKQYNPMKALDYLRNLKDQAISQPFRFEEE
ncbi:MAG: PilZ domain-containing protein [Calditrichaeota bacterium]|nr:MAG: PilZ domain-containing protein [Calditrichota bacterium]MBL1205805.1 PilZ domain-containing protein [Calditrichota bacterium]NOG45633.1 PilZ domain-containing protein [Calditrichota bacterium]